jgi:hypothetical protein
VNPGIQRSCFGIRDSAATEAREMLLVMIDRADHQGGVPLEQPIEGRGGLARPWLRFDTRPVRVVLSRELGEARMPHLAGISSGQAPRWRSATAA